MVEDIKQALARLPEEDKVSLAAWLNLQTMDEWDKKMQRVAPAVCRWGGKA